MKKKLFGLIAFAAGAIMALGFLAMPALASSGQDCDGNAVIYCGISSISNLNHKLKYGTGKSHQSAKELTALYKKYGYTPGYDDGKIVEGRVTKTNKVYVGNKVVASDVYSMGRHKTAHSTDVSGISYPLYLRHPQYSFISSSIPAYVVYNYDGSFRMAIIKSCGNIVPGHIKTKPTPVPKKYTLTILKFNDLNHNKIKDSNEPYLSNWTFAVRGNGLNKKYVTDANGKIVVSSLAAGSYTVTETMQAGWTNSTATTQVARITNANITLRYGNYRIIRPDVVQLRVIKFNDENADAVENNGEDRLAGWQFNVTGPNGFHATIVTDGEGESVIDNLVPGIYTVTEIAQSGWTNTTPTTQSHSVTLDPNTQDFYFGNRQVVVPGCEAPENANKPECKVVPPEEITNTPLPTTGPAEMAGMIAGSMAAAGGSLSYIRSKKNLKKAQLKR